MTKSERVKWIREQIAQEFGRDRDYPFFNANYREGEAPDDALVRMFNEERRHHGDDTSDDEVIKILCWG